MNFKKEAKFMLYLSIAPFLIALLLALIGPKFLSNACKNTIIQEIQSPSMNNKIVIYSRDCGATTGISTQVSILKRNKSIENKSGNICVADTDHGKAPSGPGGGPDIKAIWRGDNLVEIELHEYSRVFKQERECDGITIKYKNISEQTN